MGIRPARCYKTPHRPYTRVSVRRPRKSYVKGVPRHKVSGFQFGDPKASYDNAIYLVGNEEVQVRSEALESARVSVVQSLEKNVAKAGFFFRLRSFPHQVLRENPLATGAGADRFQQGMRQSFGNPIGSAAILKKNQIIMEVRVNSPYLSQAKKAINNARYKLPVTCNVVVEDLKGEKKADK